MFYADSMNKVSLILDSAPEFAIFMDLDETYRPINSLNHGNSGIAALEAFWQKKSHDIRFLAGWVTGSNLVSVKAKTADYVQVYPHFVASSLGSEFHWIKRGEFVESTEWNDRITATGFSSDCIADLVALIENKNINLIKQKAVYQGKYKSSFFLEKVSEHQFSHELATINELMSGYPVKLLVTQCSPAAGDPENYYDVEFLPICCGKDEAVKFVKELYGIALENTFAFGDSCNDLSMFANVGHAFWVENADAAARKNAYRLTTGIYCHGILHTLDQYLT